MGFKVRKTSYRAWPVTVALKECDSAGEVTAVEQTFVAHFRAFTEAELVDIHAAIEALYPPRAEGAPVDIAGVLARNAEYYGRLLVGWGPEVTDEAGIPMPYSNEALSSLITGPDGVAVSAGLAQALGQLRFGVAPAKNSNASLAPGGAPAASEAATSLPAT